MFSECSCVHACVRAFVRLWTLSANISGTDSDIDKQ